MDATKEMDEVWQEMADAGNAETMIVRKEEMPALMRNARSGDPDAIFQALMVNGALEALGSAKNKCLFCAEPTGVGLLAAIVFVARKIERGKAAVHSYVCEACETTDQAINDQVMKMMSFTKVVHDSGHA